MLLPRRILLPLLLPLALLVVGTVGYRLIEGEPWSLFDSLYMTVITLTTVGYGETIPLSPLGRWYTMALLVAGVGLAFYTVVALAAFPSSAQLRFSAGQFGITLANP